MRTLARLSVSALIAFAVALCIGEGKVQNAPYRIEQFLIIVPTNSVLDKHAVTGHPLDHPDDSFGLTDYLSAHSVIDLLRKQTTS